MAIKLVTIDIDGTLIRDDLTVSKKTVEKIKKVMENNIMITLCTGRPHVAAKYFAEMLGIKGYQISQNGAYIKHNISQEVILHDTLPREIAENINTLCRQYRRFSLSLLYEDICYYEKQDELAMYVNLNINLVKPIRVNDINELIIEEQKAPTKILITGEPQDLDFFMNCLVDLYEGQVNILRSGAHFLDIISIKASKGRALKILSKQLRINREEIMAIGDNFNDIDMIEFAGIGVAMGNAPEEVKNVADFVAASNNDDGVANALEKFLL
ncbi:HAD family phosphatase [Biomaibacter acetigenes]|uniref:HAD family phosphatase n=1 Tax=Biomaibacter acetigenes TaxID=2316383 RepID=A0A3G2R3I4_9FIRM|nr:Cof-type HAD-IIB family hydrolase [Biomaibacter acetigenes]AYO30074.1 HAD family phosphatase [Biomaibacter acetigenes]